MAVAAADDEGEGGSRDRGLRASGRLRLLLLAAGGQEQRQGGQQDQHGAHQGKASHREPPFQRLRRRATKHPGLQKVQGALGEEKPLPRARAGLRRKVCPRLSSKADDILWGQVFWLSPRGGPYSFGTAPAF